MQRDENLLHINNGQQIDAIHMGYRQTGAVYTYRSGLLDVHPDLTPVRSRIWIVSNRVRTDPSSDTDRGPVWLDLDWTRSAGVDRPGLTVSHMNGNQFVVP